MESRIAIKPRGTENRGTSSQPSSIDVFCFCFLKAVKGRKERQTGSRVILVMGLSAWRLLKASHRAGAD